jgi:hypothetical protein
MVAGRFREKSSLMGKVEDVKSVLFLKKKSISTGNLFEEEDF